MNKHIFNEKYKKPDFYSDDAWYEIAKLSEHAHKFPDIYIGKWFLSQAMPFILKEKIQLSDLEHVLDFFSSNSSEKPPRLGKISYVEAVRQANAWTELENKRAKRKMLFKDSEKDIQVIFEYENDTWVKLLSPEAYVREGVNMSHCVGTYVDRNSVIYSLRDEENSPHCTIEVNGGKIKQIKGKSNQLVVLKYHKSLFAFLAHLGLNVDSHDLEQYGFVLCKEGFFDANNLPEEVHLLNDRPLRLGQNAKIPRMIVANSVEIKSPKYLDLSDWKVNVLKIEGVGQNVKLPHSVKELTITNVELKADKINIPQIVIKNSSLVISNLSCNEIKCFNSKLIADIIVCKTFYFDVQSLVTVTEFNCNVLYNRETSARKEPSDLQTIVAKKINVKEELQLNYSEKDDNVLSNIHLDPSALSVIVNKTKKPFIVKWTELQQLEIYGDEKLYDLTNLKYLSAYKRVISESESMLVVAYKTDSTSPNKRKINIIDIVKGQPNNLKILEDYYMIRSEQVKK